MPFLRAALLLVLVLLGFAVAPSAHRLCRRLGVATDWIARGFCRLALALMGVRVCREGLPHPEPRLLVANHVSWIDVLAVASVEPIRFLAKHDVAAWPVIGRFARGQQAIFVDRRRRRQIPIANRHMADRMREGRSVMLFPEGTTHDGRRRGRFHTSHLACLRDRFALDPNLSRGAAQPLAISYSDPVAAWVGDASLLPHLWAVLRRPVITCRLAYGEPIAVRPGFDRKRLGSRLAATVEELLRSEDEGLTADASRARLFCTMHPMEPVAPVGAACTPSFVVPPGRNRPSSPESRRSFGDRPIP